LLPCHKENLQTDLAESLDRSSNSFVPPIKVKAPSPIVVPQDRLRTEDRKRQTAV
jgi:hypothetical protein